MTYEYDSWNRILNIRYPDNETVYYTYDLGGNLDRVHGYYNKIFVLKGGDDTTDDAGYESDDISDEITATENNGEDPLRISRYYYYYIDSIHYDKFGNRTDVWYGNGTRAGYAYDVLQRMTNLGLKNRNNAFLQNIAYTYDKAGNITRARNTSSTQNGLGGNYDYQHTYDSLYRLTYSRNSVNAYRYTLNMSYLPDGRISSKYITAKSYIDGVTVTSTKTMTYSYDTRHAPYQVVTTAWDPNAMHMSYTTSTATLLWGAGTLAEISEGGAAQDFFGDEEKRLVRYIAPDNFGYYKYDAGSERFYKCTGTYVQMTVNGRTFYASVYSNPVLYASQYLVITPTGYTKHYYAGTERIASRIGEGRFRDIAAHSVPAAKIAVKKTEANAGLPSIYYNSNNFTYLHTLTDNTHSRAPIYWTHGDHLGSTAWVTDTAGAGVQHFRYLPFGEPLYSKKTGTFSSRYTFSGKERDAESGLNYFGARYYHSELSIWLSVDPLADKYPNLSPYTYCANNPVKLVDPDGRTIVDNPYLIFNGEHGCLQIWDDNNTPDNYDDDTFIGEYLAHNNVTRSSQGKWEDGIYDMLDQKNSHKHGDKRDDSGVLLDSPNGSYGTAGCYRANSFTEKTTKKVRVGMAVHAGREHKAFLNRKTQGCVRTTPEAMEMIDNAISIYGPLQRIIIQNNRLSPDSEKVSKIVPQSLQQLNPLQIEPLPISMPKCLPDKTRVTSPFIQ